jgi:hypothetical protein
MGLWVGYHFGTVAFVWCNTELGITYIPVIFYVILSVCLSKAVNNNRRIMTIQKMAPNAWVVSHCGQMATFLRYDFIAMYEWASRMQALKRAGV